MATIYDEPFGDSSAMPTYRVSALARENVTVALSGDGGDEVFAGYRRYRWHCFEERVRRMLPGALCRSAFGLLGALYPQLDWAPRPLRAKATLQELARDAVAAYFSSVSICGDELRRRLYSADLVRELQGYSAIEILRGHMTRSGSEDPLAQVQYADIKTFLPGDILTKVDRASMANSLEVRVPLLDHTLVEWAARLPPSLKLRGGEGKHVLKSALEPYAPANILYRQKQGFVVPLVHWFRGPLRERVRATLCGPVLRGSGLFDMATIASLLETSTIRHTRSQPGALVFVDVRGISASGPRRIPSGRNRTRHAVGHRCLTRRAQNVVEEFHLLIRLKVGPLNAQLFERRHVRREDPADGRRKGCPTRDRIALDREQDRISAWLPSMSVLLVSHAFPPANAIGAVRVGKLAKYLHKAGHDVRVLAATPSSTSLALEIPPERVVYAQEWAADQIFDGAVRLIRRLRNGTGAAEPSWRLRRLRCSSREPVGRQSLPAIITR